MLFILHYSVIILSNTWVLFGCFAQLIDQSNDSNRCGATPTSWTAARCGRKPWRETQWRSRAFTSPTTRQMSSLSRRLVTRLPMMRGRSSAPNYVARALFSAGIELDWIGNPRWKLGQGEDELVSPGVALFLFVLSKFNFACVAAGDALHVRTYRNENRRYVRKYAYVLKEERVWFCFGSILVLSGFLYYSSCHGLVVWLVHLPTIFMIVCCLPNLPWIMIGFNWLEICSPQAIIT